MTAHLAILQQPYLGLILQGRKTIECRLTRHRIPPWNAATAGDTLILKQSAGPVRGVAAARDVIFHRLESDADRAKLLKHNAAIHATPEFWADRPDHRYLSLVLLEDIATLSLPQSPARSSGRAWIPLPNDPIATRLTLTPAAFRNSYLRLPTSWQQDLPDTFTLSRPGMPDTRTSLRSGFFRDRRWATFYRYNGLQPGDRLWALRTDPDQITIAIPRKDHA